MANKDDRRNIKDERIEDTTRYGEFISSFNQWQTPDKFKRKAKHLEEVTEEISPGSMKDNKTNKKRRN